MTGRSELDHDPRNTLRPEVLSTLGGGISLKHTTRVALGVFLGVLIATAAALSLVTTYLGRTARNLGTSVESVRVADALEITLIAHKDAELVLPRSEQQRTQVSWATRSRLRRLLIEARRNATSAEEQALVAKANDALQIYLNSGDAGPPTVQAPSARDAAFQAAFAALDDLLWHNVYEADTWVKRAQTWDDRADDMSFAAILLALGGAGFLVWGARTQIARPLSALHRAVYAFAAGDKGLRVAVEGPREIRDLTVFLNEIMDTIVREDHNRLVFVCGIVQELRDPLTVLKLLPASASKPIIDQQIRKVERIIRDIVDASLIESGEVDLRCDRVDVRPLIEKAVDVFRPIAPDHQFDIALPTNPVVVNCDSTRVEHVVRNLVSNAIKYSPAGGAITVVLDEEEGYAVIAVTDQGIGIHKEDQSRIFERAQRTGASREAITGVGLGLHVTRRIVEAHGGIIQVDSRPGAGSTFRVMLPLDGGVSNPLDGE